MTYDASHVPTASRRCPHTSPELVVMHSPTGHTWVAVRCGICGETLRWLVRTGEATTGSRTTWKASAG
jgi:hypothetical protein